MAYPFLVATIKSSLNNWVTITGQADYDINQWQIRLYPPQLKLFIMNYGRYRNSEKNNLSFVNHGL